MSFHEGLATKLYPNMLERERTVLFGSLARISLFTISHTTGESLVMNLDEDWSARRIPTIESPAREEWRFEITSELMTWDQIVSVTHLRLQVPTTDERQTYKVLQVENAMKPGHVYLLRCEAIDQQWP